MKLKSGEEHYLRVDLQFPEEKEISETERKAYNASVFAVFPRIEKDIKQEMYIQLIRTYSEGVGVSKSKDERDFEIIRGNGIMEGMAILLEKWQLAAKEHEASPKEEEGGDPYNPMPEL